MTQKKTSTLPDLIPLSLAAHRLRKCGGPAVSPRSIWRWVRFGVRGIKLKAVMLGGQIFVTEEALIEFGQAVAAQPAVDRRARSRKRETAEIPA